MEKYCEFCGNLLNKKQRKYCSKNCNDFVYYQINRDKKLNYQKEYYTKNFERDREKNKTRFKKWHFNNRKKQLQNIKNNYYKNKEKWNERQWVDSHRKKILKYLPKICANCKKRGIKIIHHKEYGKTPKLYIGRWKILENKIIIKNYTKRYLLGFCSKDCHKNYEKYKTERFIKGNTLVILH